MAQGRRSRPRSKVLSRRRFRAINAVLAIVAVVAGYWVYTSVQAASAPVGLTFTINNSSSQDPIPVNSGQAYILRWTTQDADYCQAGQHWTGTKPTDGSQSFTKTYSSSGSNTYNYYIYCQNDTYWAQALRSVVVNPPPKPTVSLKINGSSSATVQANSSVTLSWTTGNSPTSCSASGSWSGSKSASGGSASVNVGGAGTKTYTLSCSNAGGSKSSSVTANVQSVSSSAPTVSLKINGGSSTTVQPNSTVTLSWTTGSSPTSCSASGSWSGSKSASGGSMGVNVGSSPGIRSYILSCSNGSGSASSSVSATVTSNAPPTQPTPGKTVPPPPGVKPVVKDTTAPTVPTEFRAELDSVNPSNVKLSWKASTDASGIKSYVLERSKDRTNWSGVSDKITGTSYIDSKTEYQTAYFYRIKAVDNAGNSSGHASTNITTGQFKPTEDGSTIESEDGIVKVTIPEGALAEDASCSVVKVEDGADSLGGIKLELVHGPYSLECKKANGDFITSFAKPVLIQITPDPQKAANYKRFEIYRQNPDTLEWEVVEFESEVAEGLTVFKFTTDEPVSFALLGERKPGFPWGIVSFVILLLLVGIAVFIYLLRKAQKEHYQDYLRRKYYNL